MTARSNALYAAALACMLAGCANDGSLSSSAFNTGTIDPQKQAANEQAEKSKQALCNTLVSQIEALNTEGVNDKVSKAAAKKYKLKATDLTKADELNKANVEFQSKCSSYPPRVAATAPVDPVTKTEEMAAAAKASKTAAAKPPVPPQKPVASALAQDTTQTANAPPSGATTTPTP